MVAFNPLRADPTRTTTLRKRFQQAMTKRFNRLKGEVTHLLVVEDVFGLRPKNRLPGGLVGNTRWRALTDADKLTEFNRWLKSRVDQGLLEVVGSENDAEPWTARFVRAGYAAGGDRGFSEVRKTGLDLGDFGAGQKKEFLRTQLQGPVGIDKVRFLATRSFEDLKGVTEQMSTQINRALADGIATGKAPAEIAVDINDRVDSIGLTRARAIARTEVIRAHAEGALDAMEALEVTEVGVAVEWTVADNPCPLCAPLEGVVLKVSEARGMFPRHPNCRCTPIPANVGESTKDQLRTKSRISKAIDKSLKAEIPKRAKRSVRTQRKRSQWVGAGRTIGKARPKGILT